MKYPANAPPAVVEHFTSILEECADGMKPIDVECIQRLASHEDMKDVYDLLEPVFTEEWQWKGFIFSAWSARWDYAGVREKWRDFEKDFQSLKEEMRTAIRLSNPKQIAGAAEHIEYIGYLAGKLAERAEIPKTGAIPKTAARRQGTPATDYLRAFALMLDANHVASIAHILETPALLKSMAIVAEIVLNDPGVALDQKDVSQALAPLTKGK